MTELTGAQWYVAQTHPRTEIKASAHLNRQGFVTFMPRYLRRRKHARKVDWVSSPLFPCYLFVSIDMAVQRWRSIQSTIGVRQLVCNGEEPAIATANIIQQLRDRQDERGFVQLGTQSRFVRGDRVQVLDGVFSTCLGLYEGMADRERVAILLDLLGRKVRVILDGDTLTAA